MSEMNNPTFFSPLEINKEIERVYSTLNYTGALPTWEFNPRLTNCMGLAYYTENRLEFSFPLFLRATPLQRRETIVHEAAHVLAYKLYGLNGVGHGPLWKNIMIACGEKPARCHNVDRTGLKKKQKKVRALCKCRAHTISANKAGRIRNETAYYVCRTCRSPLEVSD